jgi:hypothetical protein
MAAFAGQGFVFQLPGLLDHFFMTCTTGVISTVKHWFARLFGKSCSSIPDLIVPAGRCSHLLDYQENNDKDDE